MNLSSIEQRVCQALQSRRAALLDDLRLHVGIPTGLGHRPGLDETRERFAARLAALGAKSELIPGDPKPTWLWSGTIPPIDATESSPAVPPPTLIARRPTTGPRVLIAGHLDTVHDPASPFNKLKLNPNGLTATGPGCVDMKGGLVIAMAALEALEEIGVRASWSFLLNSDEETGSYHSDRALAAAAREHDFGLALEPAMSKGELAIARGGSGQFMLDAFGKAAHVGRDFTAGVSAVAALASGISAAAALSDPDAGLCVNVGPLQGGPATNVVPDRARAWGNVRFPTPDGAAKLQSGLRAIARDGLPRLAVETSFNRPAKPTTPAVEALALRARAVAEDLDQSLPFAATGGVCDGNQLQTAGLPTIDTLGVRGGGLHTPDEWIELPSLVQRAQLLAVLVMRLANP